jgi:hypothetical protein
MMFQTLKARFSQFWQEVWLQTKIRFQDGRSEFKLYRQERNLGRSILWVPSKGSWVRARLLFPGQRYDRIQFVDGKRAKGKRSPLSYRVRDPRKRGADKPRVDARYSGNLSGRTITVFKTAAIGPTELSLPGFYDTRLGLPYDPEGD